MLSVLIVTRHRTELLQRCIRSVLEAAQAFPELPIELVVEVNGKDQQTAGALDVLSRTAASLGIPFHSSEESQPLSPSASRNRALARARGEWVFFADDDIYVPRSLFSDFARLLSRFPAQVALGGPNLTPPSSSLFQQASGLAMASRFGTWQSVPRYRAQGAPRTCGEESLILCNLFVKRSALGDEPFRGTLKCGEENWLIRGLSSRGQGVVYAPELRVWHERRKTVTGFARQVFWYGFGRGQNLRLGGAEKGIVRYFLPSLCVLYALALPAWTLEGHALGGLAAPFWVYGALCALAAARVSRTETETRGARAVSAFLFPLIHGAYGVGLLFGLTRRS
jgi:hypothetical protein